MQSTDDTPTVPLTIYLRDRPTNAQLAEVRVSPNATLGALRSHIRDCPEMAAFPQRMFSHWWAKTSASVFPIEIPTDLFSVEYLLSEVGIVDEGTMLLEMRGACSCCDATADDSYGAGVETDGYAAAVVAADWRSEKRMNFVLKALAECKEDNMRLLAQLKLTNFQVESLRNDVSVLKSNNTEFKDIIKALKKDNTQLANTNGALTSGFQALNEMKVAHAQDVASLKGDLGVLKKDNEHLKNSNTKLQWDVGGLKNSIEFNFSRKNFEPMTNARSPPPNAPMTARYHMTNNFEPMTRDNADLKDIVNTLQALETSLHRVKEAVGVQPHPSYPPMTVASPCSPSFFSISYVPGGRKAVIVGHEPYFNLPAGQQSRERPIHLPMATIPVGARCLVEFTLAEAPSSKSNNDCSLIIGFVPASSAGLKEPVHDIGKTPNSFTLDYFNATLLRECSIIEELPETNTISAVRRVALLMDRADAANTFLRVFVSEDGTDEGVKAHGDAKTTIHPPDVVYIPAANPIGQCELTIHNVYFGNDIPPCYAL